MLGQSVPELDGVVVTVDCSSKLVATATQSPPLLPAAAAGASNASSASPLQAPPPLPQPAGPAAGAAASSSCSLAGARATLYRGGAAVLTPVIFGEPGGTYGVSVEVSSVSGVLQETAMDANVTLGGCG